MPVTERSERKLEKYSHFTRDWLRQLLLKSVTDDPDKAIDEWDYIGCRYQRNPHGHCGLCNHVIHYHCEILNRLNGETYEIGTDCIKKFLREGWEVGLMLYAFHNGDLVKEENVEEITKDIDRHVERRLEQKEREEREKREAEARKRREAEEAAREAARQAEIDKLVAKRAEAAARWTENKPKVCEAAYKILPNNKLGLAILANVRERFPLSPKQVLVMYRSWGTLSREEQDLLIEFVDVYLNPEWYLEFTDRQLKFVTRFDTD